MSKYILLGLKKKLVWVFLEERGDRDKNNATGLKEGGGIEMSIYSAFHYAMLALLRYIKYLHWFFNS